VVHVIDLFDWPGSIVPDLPGLLKLSSTRSIDLLVAVNKCDLLPPSTNFGRVHDWIRAGLKLHGLGPAVVSDVVCVSGRTGAGCEDLLALVKERRKGRDVYVVGAANVGKSTLVNRILYETWVTPTAGRTLPGKRSQSGRGIVIDPSDLPAGYSVGDSFLGDLSELERPSHPDALDPGVPVPRWAVQDGSEPLSSSSRTSLSDAWKQATDGADPDQEVARVVALAQRSTIVEASPLGTRRGGSVGARTLGSTGEDLPPDILSGVAALADRKVPLPPVLTPLPDHEVPPSGSTQLQQAAQSLLTHSSTWLAGVPLTTSPMPGTTLGVIGAPLTPTSPPAMLYDMPGLVSQSGIVWQTCVADMLSQAAFHKAVASWAKHSSQPLPPQVRTPPLFGTTNPTSSSPGVKAIQARSPLKTARVLFPNRPLRPRHVQLRSGKSLFLGGMARIDFEHLGGPGLPMLFSVFSGLDLHQCERSRADQLFDTHAWLGGLLWPAHGSLAALASESWLYGAQREEEERRVWGSGLTALGDGSATSSGGLRRSQSAQDSSLGFRPVDWADGVPTDWEAAPVGGNPGRTQHRRQSRFRRGLVDIVFGGLGWVCITPVEIEGMYGWEKAVKGARITARAVNGVSVSLRPPLLPFEASGTRPKQWL
jgi:hypothetical protein